MKHILPLIFLFISSSLVFGQMAYIEPTGAGPEDAATLFFNATEGNGELAGATKVYVHHGVVTNAPDGEDWSNVIGNWGQDDGIGEMTAVVGEEDLWKIELTPSIRSHFGVAAGENIFRISCVFRSPDGNTKGTQAPGEYGWGTVAGNQDNYLDLNVDAYVDIVNPAQEELFVLAGENLSIRANASANASSIALLIDRGAGFTEVAQETNTTAVSFDYPITTSEEITVRVEATINGQVVSSEKTIRLTVRTATVTAALPANMRPGINYTSNPTEAVLVLEAPNKDFIYVIGDFNDWIASEAYQMQRDGEMFWITLTGLEAGREYVFQYWIDGEIKVGDPYAEKVADPWNDQYIEPSVYPDLPAYAKTENNLATVLQTDQTPYEWAASEETWERPDVNNLVIYELHVRDFIESHNYRDLIDTLSYLKRLGVDAIELMPVNEFEGNDSWGYNPSYFLAPDKYYGTKDDLKAFVEACHAQGMAVILDIVLNHAFGQNPMVRMYFDGGQPADDNPWFNREYVGQYQWGYDFDHESPYTQRFVDSVNRFWIEEYHFDGFRFDFTKGFTNYAPGGSVDGYDASRIALLKRMADKIWAYDPEAYMILEHWSPANEERELSDYGMKMWRNRSYDYVPAAVGRPSGNFNNMNATTHVSFYNSHDERRIAEHCVVEGLSEASYHVRSPEVMFERVKQAAAFTYLLPGPKMIWQFDELGYDINIDFNGRTGRKPYVWGPNSLGYYDEELRQDIYKTYSGLLYLRNQLDIDKLAAATTNHANSGDARRLVFDTDSIDLVVIGNFALSDGELSPQFPSSGTWYNFFSGEEIIITNPDAPLPLKPGEWHVFTSEKMSDEYVAATAPFIDPVTISPYPFSADEPITITFDASKASPDGTNGLIGASSVYMQAGLVTSGAYATDWAYTAGTLTPGGAGEMTPGAEPNTWSITLTARDYFDVPEAVEALRLGMFFHNGDNTDRGKGFMDTDVYYNIESSEPLLTVAPFPFKADDQVTITFSAGAGNRELADAASVYMHSGTAPQASSDPETDAWTRVVGNWGQDDGVGEMTQLNNSSTWTITLQPNEYYGLEASEYPHWLGLVFRSPDGSKKGTGNPGAYEFGFIADNFDFFVENEFIRDSTATGTLLVYPNPVIGDVLTIDGVAPDSQVQVYSSDGRLLLDERLDANTLELSRFPQGTYFFQINNSENTITGKFIK